jgi:hypothetical protein
MLNLLPRPIGSEQADLCPKCHNLLSDPEMKETNQGWHLLFYCSQCETSFAFVPVTTFRFFEVQSK